MGSSIIKKIVLVFVFSLKVMYSNAQIKIDDQPDTSFYRYVVNTITPFALTEKETVSIKAQPIPEGILDTLKKYDWFDMGGYNYIEGKFKTVYAPFKKLLDDEPQQLYFKRFCKDGIVADFSYQKTRQNTKTIYTTTFDKFTATKAMGIKKAKELTYLNEELFGELSYTQIVSYKNRQLVIDITKYGKIGEKPVTFRVIYFAIDQKFNWQLK